MRPVCPQGKRQTTQFFINRVVFIFALFATVNRSAIDPGGTGCGPYNFPPNFRGEKKERTGFPFGFSTRKTRTIGTGGAPVPPAKPRGFPRENSE